MYYDLISISGLDGRGSGRQQKNNPGEEELQNQLPHGSILAEWNKIHKKQKGRGIGYIRQNIGVNTEAEKEVVRHWFLLTSTKFR